MRAARTFRKKPVVVEAMQFDGTPESGAAVAAWVEEHGATAVQVAPYPWPCLHIKTPEGMMVASLSPGDWIVRGVKGEFYRCKPDIFAETYEPVKADDDIDPARRVQWHVRVCRICGDSAWIAIAGEAPHTTARLLCEVAERKDGE